jgi:hypothetical protein
VCSNPNLNPKPQTLQVVLHYQSVAMCVLLLPLLWKEDVVSIIGYQLCVLLTCC